MFKTIKDLFTSKKFLKVVIGSAVIAGLEYANAPKELIVFVGSLFGVGILSQGLADFGKEATKESKK